MNYRDGLFIEVGVLVDGLLKLVANCHQLTTKINAQVPFTNQPLVAEGTFIVLEGLPSKILMGGELYLRPFLNQWRSSYIVVLFISTNRQWFPALTLPPLGISECT